jgi:hypothetical protein
MITNASHRRLGTLRLMAVSNGLGCQTHGSGFDDEMP